MAPVSESIRASSAAVRWPEMSTPLTIEPLNPIPTWFRVGGGTSRFSRPLTALQLASCLVIDSKLKVLGDGANLLVDDEGIDDLVVSLDSGDFAAVEFEGDLVRVGAGVNLPKLVTESVRRGLAGLEGLGGIPATIGGAIVMNAGGAFGQIADVVSRVHALRRDGQMVTLTRSEIDFGYRRSGLNHLLITGAELQLRSADPVALREQLKHVMAYKSKSQPLGDDSAGCCFKNPTLAADLDGIGTAGARVSAGLLIDRAGLKGLVVGGARVSDRHGNFLVAEPGGKARDVIHLMALVTQRVAERFGVTLEPEVVVWRRP